MKSKLWNGGFLRTVLQGLAVTCAALLALSALGAGLTLGGVIGQQQLSAARKYGAQLFAQLRMLQRDRRGILPWRVGAGVEVFLALDHAVNDVRRSSGITNAPARHGIGLGEAVHHHGARLHARQFRNCLLYTSPSPRDA